MRIIIIIGRVLCVVLSGLAITAGAATHHYRITLSDDLARLDVEARLADAVSSVTARHRDAARYVTAARDCESGTELRIDTRIRSTSGTFRCLQYSVDLVGVTTLARRTGAVAAGALVTPITAWMWRPRLGAGDDLIVSFGLPEGVRVSVPWQQLGDGDPRFRLLPSPQSGTGLAVFGEFRTDTVRLAGAALRVVTLPSRGLPISADVVDWTRLTAANIALAYGRFPNPEARVLLFPVVDARRDAAVVSGRVVRDGGETVELLVNQGKDRQKFLRDWTATHEFSHLMLPYVDRDQRWISEGFAQYYQNILLARAGRYTEQQAWASLYAGFERGVQSRPDLSPNQAAGGDERSSRMKIYWSGAALALLADVELRRRSGGTESLDLVLDRFQACCLPSARSWSGPELLRRFDTLIDEPIFVHLYEQYADTPGFPAVRGLLSQLGVIADDGDITLSDGAALAETRAAITARRYTGEPRLEQHPDDD